MKPQKKKQKMLSDDRMLEGFCNRGRPSIGLPGRKKPKHFELLSYLYQHFPEELQLAVSRLEQLNKGMLLSIVNKIPNNIMSDLDEKLVIRLILYRKNWIFNWLEGSVKA